ncbi:MAG TPA: hypothetical protein VFN78_10650 [Ktedonobacterales bacterium]|nr:hypothetical protein [Ktedonobacterales bacterium]
MRLTLSVLLAMTLAVAGCAPVSGARSQSPKGGATTTAVGAPASPTSSASSCPRMTAPTQVGDLLIDTPSVLYGFNADYMLPDGMSAKPLAVTLQDNGAFVLGAPLQRRTVVQPNGFVITICNTSMTRVRSLTTFGVRLQSVTPYTGSLNALNGCAYLYGSPQGFGGECASGFSPDVELTAHFPSGATAQAVVTQTPGSPVALSPGQSVTVSFEIQPPTDSVIAVYDLGVGVDGAAITYPTALTTEPSIVATVARHWSGQYCQTAQMQALLPAPLPANTYYACPQA